MSAWMVLIRLVVFFSLLGAAFFAYAHGMNAAAGWTLAAAVVVGLFSIA